MKRKLIWILTALMLVALFSGCGSSTVPSPAPSATSTPERVRIQYPADAYHLAENVELDEEGYPVSKYTYALPLSETDEVFRLWTTCWTPQYLPEEGLSGFGMYQGMEKMTGVHIEYECLDAESRSGNFSVMLATDDLSDILSQGINYYKNGSYEQAIAEGTFINFADYREYMPNYLYELHSRSEASDILETAVYRENIIVSMYGLVHTPKYTSGYFIRQDWMDALGLGSSEDIRTYDELHEVLTAFRVAYGSRNAYPMMVFDLIENETCNWNGFNTTPSSVGINYVRVRDGQVELCGSTEDDRQLMTMLSQWWNEGLIDRNYASYSSIGSCDSALGNDLLGYVIMTPLQVGETERVCVNPDCTYQSTRRLVREKGQILHWGLNPKHITGGSAAVSGTCPNIPLAVTYLDWMYSEEGIDWTNWGPEGEVWEFNSAGERELTEWALNHPAGTAWLQVCWLFNESCDAGVQYWKRNYAYPAGRRFVAMYDHWDVSDYYDAAWNYPSAVLLDHDQSRELLRIRADLNTFFTENYMAFFEGSKPVSEWDEFLSVMEKLNLSRAREIYQEAYDAWMAG